MAKIERKFATSSLSLIRKQIEENRINPITIEDKWDQYGSNIASYEQYFGINIANFIARKSSPIVIDIMSPSDTLATLFEEISDKPKFGLAVSLLDKRSELQKEKDRKLGIKQLAGNILLATTWKKIEKELGGRKADLIMEKGWEGLDYIPPSEHVYAMLLNKTWGLLSSNSGLLLAQFVDKDYMSIKINEWVKYLNKSGIVAYYTPITKFATLIIFKNPNSPEKLPFLPY